MKGHTIGARDLAAALKRAIHLKPSLRPGVPRILLNLFIAHTAAWLVSESPRSKLPLFSLRTLERHFTKNKTAISSNKRSAGSAKPRAKQIAVTISAALTTLAKRLRSLPTAKAVATSEESILLSIEVEVAGRPLTIEISGPLQKHREGLNFEDDRRVGFLARIVGDNTPLQTSVAIKTDSLEGQITAASDHHEFIDVSLLAAELAQRLPEAPPRIPRQLPQPPRDFSGRDEDLQELSAAVANRETIVLLHGPDGIGKSALALALAHQLSDRYPATIFLDLKAGSAEPLTPIQVMQHVVHSYLPRHASTESHDELSGLYHSLLNGSPAILLFDNVRDAAQLQQLVPPPQSLLLVTTYARLALPGMYSAHVRPLDAESSQALLVRIAPRARPAAAEIAQLCGGFPLLLRAAGSTLLAAPNLSPSEYAQRLRDSRARMELVDPTTDRTVEAVLDLAYSTLKPAIQRRFDALAVFVAPFDEKAAAAVWRTSISDAKETLAVLIKLSFIDFHGANQQYEVHQLMRAFGEIQMRPSLRKGIERRFARYYRSTLHRLAQREDVSSDDSHEWNNILAARRYTESRAVADPSARRLLLTFPLDALREDEIQRRLTPHDQYCWLEPFSSDIPSARARLLVGRNLADLAFLYGYHEDIAMCLKTLARLTTVLPDLRDNATFNQILGALFFIGCHSADLGNLIIAYFTPMAESERAALRQVFLQNLLGALYSHWKRYEEAETAYERSLASLEVLVPRGGAGTAVRSVAHAKSVTLDLLAGVVSSRGDLKRAIKLGEQRLSLVQELNLPNGDAWGAIALSWARLGDAERATDAYRKRIRLLRRSTVAGMPVDEAKEWLDLARDESLPAEDRTRFREVGYEYLHEILRIAETGSTTYDEARALFAIGRAYLDQDDSTAASYLRRAAAGFRGTGNPEAEVRALVLLSAALLRSSPFGTASFEEGLSAREEALHLLESRHDAGATKLRESLRKWREFQTQGVHPYLHRARESAT